MPQKDTEKRKEYKNNYYANNRQLIIQKAKQYRDKNKEKTQEYYKKNKQKRIKNAMEWNGLNETRIKENRKRYRRNKKIKVLNHYSKGLMMCSCCCETDIEFLCIDHINGGGGKHIKALGTTNFYQWLINNNFPDGFQVMCYNCNFAKRDGKFCPHQRIRDEVLCLNRI